MGFIVPDVSPAVARPSNPRYVLPTYGFHQGSDDRWFFIGAIGIRDWVRIATALELDDFLNDPAYSDGVLGVEQPEDAQRLLERLEAIFRTEPRAHWLQVMVDADVAVGPLQTHEEFVQEEQVQHLGMVTTVDDAELGRTQQLGLPIIAAKTPGAIQNGAPRFDPAADPPAWRETSGPLVNIPDNGILGSGGLPAASGELPLSGIVVLDIATWVAGSYGPTLLADLGADVIKVEALDGDPYRPMALGYYGSNRNKRSLAVDLKAESGRAALDHLVAGSDIILTNLRPGPRQRLGLDYEQLERVKSDIVSVGVSTNGPTGPLKERPAYDQVFQARSGSAWQQCGGDGQEPAIITGAPTTTPRPAWELWRRWPGSTSVCATESGRSCPPRSCKDRWQSLPRSSSFIRAVQPRRWGARTRSVSRPFSATTNAATVSGSTCPCSNRRNGKH